MQTLRLSFSKLGDARYISHLDLYRCFSRAVKQAKLDVWYTEGFNSHMYLTFPLPLALGFESICEIVDLRMLGEFDAGDAMWNVNLHLPSGIECFDAAEAQKKPKEITYARYLVELKDADLGGPALETAIQNVLGQDSIVVSKKSKKGQIREIDLKPMIFNAEVSSGEDGVLFDLTLPAGSENSVNPMLLLGEVLKQFGKQPEFHSVRRTQILTADFNNFQ